MMLATAAARISPTAPIVTCPPSSMRECGDSAQGLALRIDSAARLVFLRFLKSGRHGLEDPARFLPISCEKF